MSINIPKGKRLFIVSGHYGSGKTEFCVNFAAALSKSGSSGYSKIALCDLDVVNPYFRSREQTEMLNSLGVKVYGGIYGTGSTAEIPEISAAVRTPLEDPDCFTIVDLGGNDSGARILAQFRKYFNDDNTYLAAVINASRPETATVSGAMEHLGLIESALGMEACGLISNTHMLRETTSLDVMRGFELCKELSDISGKEIFCVCYPEALVSEDELKSINVLKMPVGMLMRQTWLDK